MTLARLPWSFCSILTLSRGLLFNWLSAKGENKWMCKHCLSFTIADLNYICYFTHSITLILMFTASYSFIEVICVYIYYCLYLLCIFVCHFNQLLEKSLSNSKIDQFSVALNNNSIIYSLLGFSRVSICYFYYIFQANITSWQKRRSWKISDEWRRPFLYVYK